MKRLMKKLFRPLKQKAAAQHGFTLLEILVVLTIMGFLIAMVAPRLGGISSSAVDTVCDSNQSRMTSMMSGFFEKTNRFPNKMTNLVEELDDTAASEVYQIPAVSDDDPANGPETLASEFMSRNHFRIHHLNNAELAELRNMGITTVLNLNAYDWLNDAQTAAKEGYDATAAGPNDVALVVPTSFGEKMEDISVPTNTTVNRLAVAMVGIGHNATTWNVHTDERNWGEPDWFGRIVLGFGPENSVVTSGIVANAAHCPGGIQNADNVTYNDYNLVLPRLEATAARFDADAALINAAGLVDLEELKAVAYDDEPAAANYVIATNSDNLKSRTFDISAAQERWQYATQCPEGHMFPADDEEFWGIDIDDDGNVN